MVCPKCKSQLLSDILPTCPFCGTVIKKEETAEPKKISVYQPFSGAKKQQQKAETDKRAGGVRGPVPNFPPEKGKDDNFDKNTGLKSFTIPDKASTALSQSVLPPINKKDVLSDSSQDKTQRAQTVNMSPDPGQKPPVTQITPKIDNSRINEKQQTGEVNLEQAPPLVKAREDEKPMISSPIQEDISVGAVLTPEVRKKKGIFRGRKKDIAEEGRTDEMVSLSTHRFRGKQAEASKSSEDQEVAVIEDDPFDTNVDGYYDDLLPDVSREINKIPQDNIIKAVGIILFAIVASVIILYTS